MRNAEGLRIQGFVADCVALLRIQLGQETVRIGPGFGFGFTHDDMRAEAIFQRPSKFCRARGHVFDKVLCALNRFWPHQIHIATFGSSVFSRGRETTEVQRRTFAADGLHARGIEIDFIMFAINRQMFAIQQCLEDLHRLDRPAIARFAVHLVTRQVRRDDVDVQPPTRNLVQRGNLPRQLRGPAFANTHRHQQLDTRGQRRNGAGKSSGIQPKRVARGKQYIVEPALFRGEHDIAAMLPT